MDLNDVRGARPSDPAEGADFPSPPQGQVTDDHLRSLLASGENATLVWVEGHVEVAQDEASDAPVLITRDDLAERISGTDEAGGAAGLTLREHAQRLSTQARQLGG